MSRSQESWEWQMALFRKTDRLFSLTYPCSDLEGQPVTQSDLTWHEAMAIWQREGEANPDLALSWCEPFPPPPDLIHLALLPAESVLAVPAPAP